MEGLTRAQDEQGELHPTQAVPPLWPPRAPISSSGPWCPYPQPWLSVALEQGAPLPAGSLLAGLCGSGSWKQGSPSWFASFLELAPASDSAFSSDSPWARHTCRASGPLDGRVGEEALVLVAGPGQRAGAV